ncbi:MAG: DNA endonuclease SmrA [Pseudomonadales bacterium]|jgi:DNA-nicking Smr family endonuclease|nr:DNA endonuclease SmrA [Pseudomonadales bacterium]
MTDMHETDEDLFAQEMRDVVPLPDDGRATPKGMAGAPTLAQLARRRAALAEDGDPNFLTLGEVRAVGPWDQLAWKDDGVQEGVYRKLRLGRYPLEAVLDLHRRTVREAREDLWRFVEDGFAQGLRTVLISHGRGDRSETPGRLKSYVAHWLEQLPAVLAFHTAQRQHGSYGAVYVLFRKNAEGRLENRERHARRAR